MIVMLHKKEKWWQSVISDCVTWIVIMSLIVVSALLNQPRFELVLIFLGMVYIFGGKDKNIKTAHSKKELEEISERLEWE